MRSERVKDALDGIRINIEAIRAFVDGMTYKSFAADLRTFYAVTLALEIISEASRRLPDDLKARYPGVPWRAVQDAGNVYRHTYNKISAEIVWDTALEQLDGLWEFVRLELGRDGTDPAKRSGLEGKET